MAQDPSDGTTDELDALLAHLTPLENQTNLSADIDAFLDKVSCAPARIAPLLPLPPSQSLSLQASIRFDTWPSSSYISLLPRALRAFLCRYLPNLELSDLASQSAMAVAQEHSCSATQIIFSMCLTEHSDEPPFKKLSIRLKQYTRTPKKMLTINLFGTLKCAEWTPSCVTVCWSGADTVCNYLLEQHGNGCTMNEIGEPLPIEYECLWPSERTDNRLGVRFCFQHSVFFAYGTLNFTLELDIPEGTP